MIYYSEKTGGFFTKGGLEELRMKGMNPPPVRQISEEEYRLLSQTKRK